MKQFIFSIIKRLIGENKLSEYNLARKFYIFSLDFHRAFPVAIYSLDGKLFTNGLADRLRGMISVYAYAKCNAIPFRINHQTPFPLEDYIVPNIYDWTFQKHEYSDNLLYANPICLMDYTKGYRMFFLNSHRQHHFYTNIDCLSLLNKRYKKQYTYSQLFQELFKPSSLLQSQVDICEKSLGNNYISISFRFMQLMGDFKDIRGLILDDSDRADLIERCIGLIYSLKERHSEVLKILVTSDSMTFMHAIANIPFVYQIPGVIGHIGHVDNSSANLKTFLDFWMISLAKKAYMGYTGDMYKSNFAKSAANSTGILYEELEF